MQRRHVEVMKLLKRAGADIELTSSCGLTAVGLAGHFGRVRVIRLVTIS